MKLRLSGEIDYACRGQLSRALVVAQQAMPGDAVVDMTRVTFCFSEALAFNARLARLVVEEHGGTVTLHNPGRATTRLVARFEGFGRIVVTRDQPSP